MMEKLFDIMNSKLFFQRKNQSKKVFQSFLWPPVWPDDGIKSWPIFPQYRPKITQIIFHIKVVLFKIDHTFNRIFGHFCKKVRYQEDTKLPNMVTLVTSDNRTRKMLFFTFRFVNGKFTDVRYSKVRKKTKKAKNWTQLFCSLGCFTFSATRFWNKKVAQLFQKNLKNSF